MDIMVNGTPKNVADTVSLAELITSYSKNDQHVIAEVNTTIIKRAQWAETRLQPNDRVELVSFVGGG